MLRLCVGWKAEGVGLQSPSKLRPASVPRVEGDDGSDPKSRVPCPPGTCLCVSI